MCKNKFEKRIANFLRIINLENTKENNILLEKISNCINWEYIENLVKEPEEFKITETGLYKTRDGRRAYVYEVGDVGCNYFIQGESLSCYRCSIYGIYSTDPNKIDEDDIISKWED